MRENKNTVGANKLLQKIRKTEQELDECEPTVKRRIPDDLMAKIKILPPFNKATAKKAWSVAAKALLLWETDSRPWELPELAAYALRSDRAKEGTPGERIDVIWKNVQKALIRLAPPV
jgi:hypothetical protein